MIDLDTPVEYWHPQVGQRVRITGAIAECPLRSERPDGTKFDGHPTDEVSRCGTVRQGTMTPLDGVIQSGHTYEVLFDEPDSEGYEGSMYASCELEPADGW